MAFPMPVTLTDRAGQQANATIVHVFNREEFIGVDADPFGAFTLHQAALTIFRSFNLPATRVALATVNRIPIFLVESSGRWVHVACQPVRISRRKTHLKTTLEQLYRQALTEQE